MLGSQIVFHFHTGEKCDVCEEEEAPVAAEEALAAAIT